MATRTMRATRSEPLAPNRGEVFLGWASLALLAVVLIAIARGYPAWGRIPATIWLHLATMMVALALTPVMLWRPRGTRWHRRLGAVWVGALGFTAVLSFWIRTSNPGHFSFIHLISVYVLIQLPIVVLSARAHDHRRHRRAVRGLVIGALLVAGFFTFPFHRLLGDWLVG